MHTDMDVIVAATFTALPIIGFIVGYLIFRPSKKVSTAIANDEPAISADESMGYNLV